MNGVVMNGVVMNGVVMNGVVMNGVVMNAWHSSPVDDGFVAERTHAPIDRRDEHRDLTEGFVRERPDPSGADVTRRRAEHEGEAVLVSGSCRRTEVVDLGEHDVDALTCA